MGANQNLASDRKPGLDVLRAFAVLWVVLYHSRTDQTPLWIRGVAHFGWMGVDLFFVLSGYLIAGQWFSLWVQQKKPSTLKFYARRFLRTLPTYFVVLGFYLALQKDSLPEVWRYFLFLQNYHFSAFFSHSWSLCVEEQFYLVFPFVSLFLFKRRKKYLLWIVPVSVLGLEILIRFLIFLRIRPDEIYFTQSYSQAFEAYLNGIFYPTYTRLDGLTVGVSLAGIRYFRPNLWTFLLSIPRWTMGIGLGFLFLAATILYVPLNPLVTILGFTLVATGFGALLLYSVSENSYLARKVIPGASWIATLSYSMYLVHPLAIGYSRKFLEQLQIHFLENITGFIVSLGALVISAFFLYWIVEKPFLRLRERFRMSV